MSLWFTQNHCTPKGPSCKAEVGCNLQLAKPLRGSAQRVPDTRPEPEVFFNTRSVPDLFSKSSGISGIGYFRKLCFWHGKCHWGATRHWQISCYIIFIWTKNHLDQKTAVGASGWRITLDGKKYSCWISKTERGSRVSSKRFDETSVQPLQKCWCLCGKCA